MNIWKLLQGDSFLRFPPALILAAAWVGLPLVSSGAGVGESFAQRFAIDFSSPGSGFEEAAPWEVAGGELRYRGGEARDIRAYNIFDQPVSADLQYEVQAAWRGGDPEAGFGVVFRIAEEGGKHVLWINRKGCFEYLYVHPVPDQNEELALAFQKWQQNDAIRPDGFNTLKIICQGEAVQGFINDVLVYESGDDSEYGPTVHVGLIASTTVKCAFDNFMLEELSTHDR